MEWAWTASHVGGRQPLRPSLGWECVCVGLCGCMWGHIYVSLGSSSLGHQGMATPHHFTAVPMNYKLVYCIVVSRYPVPFCSILWWTW